LIFLNNIILIAVRVYIRVYITSVQDSTAQALLAQPPSSGQKGQGFFKLTL